MIMFEAIKNKICNLLETKKGMNAGGIVGIALGVFVVVLIIGSLLSPIITSVTAGNTSLAGYSTAQTIWNLIPIFLVLTPVLGIIAGGVFVYLKYMK